MIERKQIYEIVNAASGNYYTIRYICETITDRIMELIEADQPNTMTVSEARACAAGSIAFHAPVLIIPDPKPKTAPVEPDWAAIDVEEWLDANTKTGWLAQRSTSGVWDAHCPYIGATYPTSGSKSCIDAIRGLASRVWKLQQEEMK